MADCYPFLPCPICNGCLDCGHSIYERANVVFTRVLHEREAEVSRLQGEVAALRERSEGLGQLLEPDLLELAAEACSRVGTPEMADVATELRAKAKHERNAIAGKFNVQATKEVEVQMVRGGSSGQ